MMGKFKTLDAEQQEMMEAAFQEWDEEAALDFAQVMEEMHERNTIWSAVELCRRDDYGYSKFLDELHKALKEARGQSES
jgi:hypothetical protein